LSGREWQDTVYQADKIIALEQGKGVETGSRASLLAQNAVYAA